MNRKKLLNFKRKLGGVPLKVKTGSGDVVTGLLATRKVEKQIIGKTKLPFNVDDYLVLIVEEERKASFLLASDVEFIEVSR